MPQHLKFTSFTRGALTGPFIDLTQFTGIAAESRAFCRACQKATPFYATTALKANRRPDRDDVWPPREMEMNPFCALCGWMYQKAVIGARLKVQVRRRDGRQCVYCGLTDKSRVQFACDHLVPEIEGGETVIDNLAWSCKTCNSTKGRRREMTPRFGRFAHVEALRKFVEANRLPSGHIRYSDELAVLWRAANRAMGKRLDVRGKEIVKMPDVMTAATETPSNEMLIMENQITTAVLLGDGPRVSVLGVERFAGVEG